MPLIRLQTPRPWHRSLHSSLKLLLPRPPTRLWLPRRRSRWLPPPCPLLADLRQQEAHRAPSLRYLLTTPQIQRPWPGFTPLATSIAPTSGGVGSTASGCNDALFIGETLPDKSVIKPGKDFSKAWQLQNSGTCNWDEGYVFTFRPELSSSEIKGYDVAINNSDEVTKPNHSQTFVVKLTAPSAAGEYKGYWQLKTDSGSFFGPIVFLDIVVK